MKKRILVLSLIFIMAMALVSCGKTTVTWLDGDGSVLFSEQVEKESPIPQKPLPEDNDEWDYIEWSVSGDEKQVVYTAVREAKDRYEWYDEDGTLLYKESVKKGESAPTFELPADTEDFDYTEWEYKTENGVNVYTASGFGGKTLLWKNVDGEVLYRVFVKDGEAAPERFLPNDTVEWHYTNWEKTEYGFVAVRTAKEIVHWLDVDGSELFLDGVLPGEKIEPRSFPKDSRKWIYKEWVDITEAGGEKTFIATADINPKYFSGNVFQIVVKDLYGTPRSVGSGFVFNSSGWFVTNYHVIENAVSANAIFEIANYSTGDSYTTLKISHAYYSSPEKDIFIGRIEDYKTISSHYQKIPLVRDYKVGDIVYSVGYPNASIKMEINKGEVVDESNKKINSLYEKLVGGASYIPNTAFIAPGSSGGILINENLEVIGITTGCVYERNVFSLGAAIQTFNFQNTANNVSTKNEKEFIDFFYPLKSDLIEFFVMGESHENCVGLFKDSSGTYYQYLFEYLHDTGKDSTDGIETVLILVYDDGRVVCTRIYEWSIGHVSTSILSGYYSGNPSSINSFTFATTYMWPSGRGYTVSSDNINYSSNVKQTLKDCVTTPVGNTTLSEGHTDNARNVFNNTYERLYSFFEKAK